MTVSRLVSACAAMAAVVVSAPLAASGPTFWTVATAADFLRGTSDGVFVTLGGVVTAGPPLTNRLTSTAAQVWSVAQAPDGTLWAGTGGDGKLLRLRPGQAEETVFDAPEANIFAVTTAGTRVYAASAPDGKVYVVDGDAAARVFFDPEEKYIWALAVDGAGRLWVGAGNPAVVYRVTPDGTGQVVYKPAAAHVVSLATDASGRVLAGTEAPGRLYRFDANDRPFVLLDSGLQELRASSANEAGVVFAAAVAKGEEAASAGETTSVAIALAQPTSGAGATTTMPPTKRSTVFRIEPSGTWEELWTSPDVIFDLAAQTDGSVLVASGPEGRLYRIEPSREVHLFTGVDARQITRFATPARGAAPTAFATANPGRVVAIGSGAQTPATYVSSVRDTKSVATWGQIRWDATGGVTLASRSGNTERPDDSWSEWSPAYTRADGAPIASPPARFMQWRAVLTRAATGPAPALTSVTVAYLPRNNRPHVTSITTYTPGLAFQRPFVNDESAIAGLDETALAARRPPGDTGPTPPQPNRRLFQKGLQTLAWKAEDEDADTLSYTVLSRREGETAWRELRRGLGDSIYAWDTTTVADGRYVLRVRASDGLSNPAERALTGERDSDSIEVDNTAPTMAVDVVRQGTSTRLVVRVTDAQSPIQPLEYSVGGASWITVYPVDGLADGREERFEIVLPAGTNASDVALRAADALRNVVSQAGPR